MNDSPVFSDLAAKLVSVRERVGEAAKRSGRKAEAVRIIAVTKYAQVHEGFLEALYDSGCYDYGEARPQSLLEKSEAFSKEQLRWHLIGSLQRNKVRKMLAACDMIHSIDSFRLLEAVQRIAEEERLEHTPPLLLELNISEEESKHGFEADELPGVLERVAEFSRLRIRGLMGMSGLYSDEDAKRRQFAFLRKTAESLRKYETEHVTFSELSMGMSDDFELAIEEGATLVRLGSVLYRP